MRLTRDQIFAMLDTATSIGGADVEVLLFGSRLDDSARGGDVDLVIETDAGLSVLERAQIKATLEERLGLLAIRHLLPRHAGGHPCSRLFQCGVH